MKIKIERFEKEIKRINEVLKRYGAEIRDVSRYGVTIDTTSESPFSMNGFARLDFVVNEGVVELVIHTKSSEYTLEEIEDRLRELKEVYSELEECFHVQKNSKQANMPRKETKRWKLMHIAIKKNHTIESIVNDEEVLKLYNKRKSIIKNDFIRTFGGEKITNKVEEIS